jgi:hypothetical protein
MHCPLGAPLSERLLQLKSKLAAMRWTKLQCHLVPPGAYMAFIRFWSETCSWEEAINWYIRLWHWFGDPSVRLWDDAVWDAFLEFPDLLSFIKPNELSIGLQGLKRSSLCDVRLTAGLSTPFVNARMPHTT